MTSGPSVPPADLMRRIRVLRARQRIENVADGLLCHIEGEEAAARPRRRVKTRLLLLLYAVEDDLWAHRYRLAERAKAVYAGTSDVLHSRRTYIDVPDAVLHEWESVVEELEAVTAAADGTAPQG